MHGPTPEVGVSTKKSKCMLSRVGEIMYEHHPLIMHGPTTDGRAEGGGVASP